MDEQRIEPGLIQRDMDIWEMSLSKMESQLKALRQATRAMIPMCSTLDRGDISLQRDLLIQAESDKQIDDDSQISIC